MKLTTLSVLLDIRTCLRALLLLQLAQRSGRAEGALQTELERLLAVAGGGKT